MPIPGSASHRVVYATYLDAAGDPAVGFVEFYPSLVLTDAADTSFITTEPLIVELDDNGYMSADLMCTDDADLQPAGWVWRVEEHLTGGRRFNILVPNGSSPIPLTGLGVAQQLPPNVGTAYVPWAVVGQAGGVPPLDSSGIIPIQYVPGTANVVTFTNTSPSSPYVNQLWWNTATQVMSRWDGSSWVAITSAVNEYEFTFTVTGTVSVGTQAIRNYLDFPAVIESVRASVGVAPTGSFLRADVQVNGSSIFPTAGSRPTIAATTFTAFVSTNVAVLADDYLTISVTDVGSTVPGSGLVVVVRARRAS